MLCNVPSPYTPHLLDSLDSDLMTGLPPFSSSEVLLPILVVVRGLLDSVDPAASSAPLALSSREALLRTSLLSQGPPPPPPPAAKSGAPGL